MIPNYQDLNAKTSGVTDSGAFKISTKHSGHIMKILRDQLYSDKKMAVLREYSANAWDANREAGNGDKPIKVTLPTVMDPTLTIRDYGPGISHQDVFEIYAQYGESTKRTKNGQVGMLGIGSKSGFAYTDSFTVTTWQEGIQRIYTALLDTGEGSMNLLDAAESDEPDGTMIQIPVRPNDIPEFEQKAQKLFIHFKPRPEINTNLPPELVPEVVMQHGTISRGGDDWYAVMGCIAYKIDLSQLRGLNAHRGGAGEFLDRLNGYLYFNIGDVEIAASREQLEYSDKTKAVLIDKFIDLVDEFVKQTLESIEKGDFSFWEKRCRAQVLNDLHLPVPKIFSSLTDDKFTVGDPKTFIVTYGQKQSTLSHIHVDKRTRLIIRNETRRIDGYGLSGFDYVIRQKKDIDPVPTLDEVRAELQTILEEQKVVGVPIVDISSITWHQKAKFVVAPMKTTNRKHTVKTFVLKADDETFSNPYSDHWNIETITPTDKDVFVLLRKFKVLDTPEDDEPGDDFYGQFIKDKRIMKALKQPMPKIYGYKSTVKDPVKLDDLQGKQYSTWRVEFFEALTSDPRVKEVFEATRWLELIIRTHNRHYYRESDKLDPKVIGTLFKELGRDHPISKFFGKMMISKKQLSRVPDAIRNAVRGLCDVLDEAREDKSILTPQKQLMEELEEAYPMLDVAGDNGIKGLLDEGETNLAKWIEYFKLVDLAKKGLSNEQGTVAHGNGRVDHDRLEGQTARSEEGSAQLPQPEERDREGEAGRELGRDRGPSVCDQDGQGMVEQQVPADRGFCDLPRAASA